MTEKIASDARRRHTAAARSAAEISSTLKLAMADAIIYATGMQQDADILACDAHFSGLGNVVYIQKDG